MTGIVGLDTDANHGHILGHRRGRSTVSLVLHITRGGQAAVLELRRHAIVLLGRRIGIVLMVVAGIDGIHLLLLLLLGLLMVLWHVLLLVVLLMLMLMLVVVVVVSSSASNSWARAGHVHGHASSSVYVLPSRQMVAVTHPAGVGIRVIRVAARW